MEKREKFEKLQEMKGKVTNVTKYPDGSLEVGFVREKGKEEILAEFSLGPEDFKRINFKGHLEPGMDIVLWVDEMDMIKNMERVLH